MRIFMLVACLWAVTIPVESKITFYSHRDGNFEIYTMNSDGSNQTRLTSNAAADSSPVWSPNGRQIAFDTNRDGNDEIYVMDADGKNQHRLTHNPGIDAYPNWSPDGAQIAFASIRNANKEKGNPEIYVMNADGSNLKQITDLGWATRPRWSPDGKWILFERGQIYAIRPDGTEMWQVSTPREKATMILGGWSPDGKRVLYTEAVGININTSFPVIATLAQNGRAEVISWKSVNVPPMPYHSASFSADGKAILFSGLRNIYRFDLISKQLIQLTHNLQERANTAPQEWDSRLPVSPRGLSPKHWGEIKSGQLPLNLSNEFQMIDVQ